MENKIGQALERVYEVAQGRGIVRSDQMSRGDRELLLRTHWIEEIIRGWYRLTRPDAAPGDSSGWYAHFWDFLSLYLDYHYGGEYCLSAESSLDLHTGSTTIPQQVVVVVAQGGGAPRELPFGTSVLIYADQKNLPVQKEQMRGLNVMPLPLTLCKLAPIAFSAHPEMVEMALRMVRDPTELVRVILEHTFVRAAERLVGAYQFLGLKDVSRQIQGDLETAGMKLIPSNPFERDAPLLPNLALQSPYAVRISLQWARFREGVLKHFPKEPGLPKDGKGYLQSVEENYTQDAYNSLSIEGYRVDAALIEKVKNHAWNPDLHPEDARSRDALAARGYFDAFQKVRESLVGILDGEEAGCRVKRDLPIWFQHLFKPSVDAGLLESHHLFGYRRTQVYIRDSRHVPFPSDSVLDGMEAFFSCLEEEKEAAVRAILGHFFLVYIHPYLDGNGRMARFLMNVMLASGGYPWTILHVGKRDQYFAALEAASVGKDILPFVQFVAAEMPIA